MWLYFPYKAGEKAAIAGLNIEIPIEQIYQNVRLESASTGMDVEV